MTRQLAPSVQAVIGGESEAQFQSVVIGLAKAFGWMVYHTKDSRRSEAGFPDLMMIRHDRVIAAELKRQKGSLTVAQARWLAAMEQTGIEVHTWRPADKQRIAEILR